MSWNEYTIPLEDIKEYLKIEHNLEDTTLNRIAAAAIEKARVSTNREFDTVPADVELAILKTIAWNYENRDDSFAVPPEAEKTFMQHHKYAGV